MHACPFPCHLCLQPGTARVIGSYNGEDPSDSNLFGQYHHDFRQSRSLNLLKGLPVLRTSPSDSNSFIIRNRNVS